MSEGQPTTIGAMRNMVILATRQDTAVGAYNVDEAVTEIATIHAEIKPVSLLAFIGSEQIDYAITHRITFRWQPFPNLHMFTVILRRIVLPDDTIRTERYRVHRIEEYQGRHRYIIADTEMERASNR